MEEQLREFLASPIPWLVIGIILGLMSAFMKKKR